MLIVRSIEGLLSKPVRLSVDGSFTLLGSATAHGPAGRAARASHLGGADEVHCDETKNTE